MIRCISCTIPNSFPGSRFDESGKCKYCREFNLDDYKKNIKQAHKELDALILEIKSKKSESRYECIVALSGGKDSCFTLKYMAVEKKLKVLAITVDNGFLSDQSIINSQKICEDTGTDFIMFKPSFLFMKNMYKESMKNEEKMSSKKIRASDMCSSCINLINSIMVKEALTRNIPMIAGGYIAGQVPKGSCVIKLNLKTLYEFNILKSHNSNERFYGANQEDIEKFTFSSYLSIVNPLLSINYNQSKILTDLKKIGWKKSDDTGAHSSNCKINDLGIINHQKKYGFHPYELEISEQVRTGNLKRKHAISKLESEISKERIDNLNKVLSN